MNSSELKLEDFKEVPDSENESAHIEYRGVHYDDWCEVIMGVFGFCGCGLPERTLSYIHDALELMTDRGPELGKWQVGLTIEDMRSKNAIRDAWWAEHRAKTKALHGSDGAAYFFWYVLDQKELTEHGGSVPGWLSENGKVLLELLRRWKATLTPEEIDNLTL